MADTSYLTQVVEPYLRDWAGKQLGVKLLSRTVIVGKNTDGESVSFQFDGVSEDGTVGVCVSASSSYKTGQMRKFFIDATLLNRVPAFKRRVMVFTSSHIWDAFKNECDGLVDLCRIEPLVCRDLPREMLERIEAVYRESAKEVGDKRGPGRNVRGKRR